MGWLLGGGGHTPCSSHHNMANKQGARQTKKQENARNKVFKKGKKQKERAFEARHYKKQKQEMVTG